MHGASDVITSFQPATSTTKGIYQPSLLIITSSIKPPYYNSVWTYISLITISRSTLQLTILLENAPRLMSLPARRLRIRPAGDMLVVLLGEGACHLPSAEEKTELMATQYRCCRRAGACLCMTKSNVDGI
jgi:hypothetical protein